MRFESYAMKEERWKNYIPILSAFCSLRATFVRGYMKWERPSRAIYAGKDLVVISILRGAAIFMADLVRQIDLPLEMDFMAVSSYGKEAESSGIVRIQKDLSTDIMGRDVLIAEDVIDTGLTLRYLIKNLQSRKPASLSIAALLRKDIPEQADLPCHYLGFACPDEFVVGYGLDYAEKYRNLPYVGALKRSAIAKKA